MRAILCLLLASVFMPVPHDRNCYLIWTYDWDGNPIEQVIHCEN